VVGEIQDFGSTQQSHREKRMRYGWKKDRGDHNLFRSQSRMSIGAVRLRIGTLCSDSRLSGSNKASWCLRWSRKDVGKKNEMSSNELAERLTGRMRS
jgi:hypothetical protein